MWIFHLLSMFQQKKTGNFQFQKFFQKIRVTILTQGGLAAVRELEKLEEERRMENTSERKEKLKFPTVPKGVANNEMCTFLIINISSLQLIPVNMIAYRSEYGSGNSAMIVGPAIAATAVSTIVAVIYCKMMDRRRKV